MYDDSVIISVCFMILSSVNPLAISSNLTVVPPLHAKTGLVFYYIQVYSRRDRFGLHHIHASTRSYHHHANTRDRGHEGEGASI